MISIRNLNINLPLIVFLINQLLYDEYIYQTNKQINISNSFSYDKD